MIWWLLIASPMISYLLLLPLAAGMTEIFGRDSLGESGVEEFLVIWGLVVFFILLGFIRKRGFTNDS